MICIRYANDELDIKGSADDLCALYESVLALASVTGGGDVVVTCDSSLPPDPYDTCVKTFRIRSGSGKNLFRVVGDELVLEGESENLVNFAKNLPFDAEDPASGISYHVHYDSLTSPVDTKSPECITLTLWSA